MTFRGAINSVLRRLREDTISSDWSGDLVDATGITDYQKLIGDFVNEVKREVEDAWDWTSLRRTQAITTVSGTKTYTITSTTQRTRLLSVLEQSEGYFLKSVGNNWIKSTQYPASSETSSKPYYYSLSSTSNGVLVVQLYPKPDSVYSIDFNLVDPQDDLSLATDTLSVPTEPVILGAWARAISERGEDGGSQSGDVYGMYTKSLSDHIAINASNYSDELTWASN